MTDEAVTDLRDRRDGSRIKVLEILSIPTVATATRQGCRIQKVDAQLEIDRRKNRAGATIFYFVIAIASYNARPRIASYIGRPPCLVIPLPMSSPSFSYCP